MCNGYMKKKNFSLQSLTGLGKTNESKEIVTWLYLLVFMSPVWV